MKISIQEYIDLRIEELEKRLDIKNTAQDETVKAALYSSEKAITKAETAIEKRLDSVNEFRGMLSDTMANFVTEVEFKAICKEIQTLKEFRAEIQGKASQRSVMIAGIIAMISIVLNIVSLILR